ncbi:MAG TPA: AsmA family protein [Bryobacteraceae bacterium]|nr:AsmA family protein [Bryobacteraceae bacterium]
MKRPARRALLVLLAAVAGVIVLAPVLSADRFKERIRTGLERALMRKVEIQGRAHFSILAGPGFSVDNVLISEDPSMGIEPFAHVGTLTARIRLRSLLYGRMEFSSLLLDEPSVNLVRMADGPWNVQPLLKRAITRGRPAGGTPPDIEVRTGRLNFKFGDTKSVFYLSNADVDVYALSGNDGAFAVRFSGEPSRTDRAAQSLGRLIGRGQWHPGEKQPGRLNVYLEWEKSPLAEVWMLGAGRDLGVHGHIASQARIEGVLPRLDVTGTMQVDEIHRWDLRPARGQSWPISYRGTLDLASETLDVAMEDSSLPVSAHFRATGLLSAPALGTTITFRQAPMAPAASIARHMGLPLPPDLELQGTLDGVIGYSGATGFQGRLAMMDTSASMPSAAPVTLERADVVVSGRRVELLPATVEVGKGQPARVEGEYDGANRTAAVRIQTRSLAISDLKSTAGRLLGASSPPLLSLCVGGRWRGSIRHDWATGSEGAWSGNFDLLNTAIPISGLNSPVRIASASAVLKKNHLLLTRIEGEEEGIAFRGEYRFDAKAEPAHRLSITIPEAEAAAVELALRPTLGRPEGFFARAFRFGRARLPDWLKNRNAQALVHIGRLTGTGTAASIEALRADVVWTGPAIELRDVRLRYAGGSLRGSGGVDLSRAEPGYKIKAHLNEIGWREGTVSGDLDISTSGTGPAVLRNLKSAGCLNAQSVEILRDPDIHALSGCFEFWTMDGVPRLELTSIKASSLNESFLGTGSLQPDGRLTVDLTSGPRQVRMAGTLNPWQFEVSTEKAERR